MKKMIVLLSSFTLITLLSLSAIAQEMQKKPPKPQKVSMPTTDADIQKCIEEKFASAASLKDKKPTVSVSGGVAIITGEAKNGGAKGAATKIAKSCGAKEIKNNLTVAASTKKPTEKKN
jgi:osmotically-inducible protein OsmY